jgi:leader peptidase (prepilin peptidase)/N-methyltransferase
VHTILGVYIMQEKLLLVVICLLVSKVLYRIGIRLPQTMYVAEKNDVANYTGDSKFITSPVSYLARTKCNGCQRKKTFDGLIPLIGFLFCIFGKRCCFLEVLKSNIVDWVVLFSTIFIYSKYGMTTAGLFGLLFTYLLVILAISDFSEKLLPDVIVYPLLWFGLYASTQHIFISTEDAIFGAILGYISIFVFTNIYELIRKKEAMGRGDFKLIAALCTFIGFSNLMNLLIIASSFLMVFAFTSKLFKRDDYYAFGPFLCASGWLLLFYKPQLITYFPLL